MKPSDVTDLLFSKLNYTANRQKVIASNIANVNTPNYRTKDIDFQSILSDKINNGDLKLTVTNPHHISSQIPMNKSNISKIYEVKNLEEQNDGNNVDIDKQMINMAENQISNKIISNAIKKDALWFKLMVDASSKS